MNWTPEQYQEYLAKHPGRESTICAWCKKEFPSYRSHHRKYCSPECAYADPQRVDFVKPKERGSSKCENCGKEFKITTVSGKARFCSQSCARSMVGSVTMETNRRKLPRTKFLSKSCKGCGLGFESWQSAHRGYCSQACWTKHVKPHNRRYQSGWVPVGNKTIHVRSQWESNYAFFLEFQKNHGLIKDWEFEPTTFWFEGIKRGTRSYLPDFRVIQMDGSEEYHELKGWMNPRSKTKLKRMKKYHPTVKLVLIDAERYKGIAKNDSRFVPGWGTKPLPRKSEIETRAAGA